MEGIRVTTMLSPDMVSALDRIASREFSNKNVLLRQAVALFLHEKSTIVKLKSRKSKSQGK